MHLALRQLPAAIYSFAVLLLGLVVVAPPASAGDSSLPADSYICHATGNAASVEDVANWSRQSPNSEGVLSGHVGASHQNGNDIIPPLPGVLPAGQNWTSYGQQVHADGCSVPRPAQPAVETRSLPGSEESCATGGVTSWVDVYTRPYVWSHAEHAWVPGQETGPVRTDETFVAYSDQEYFAACADAQPSAETRSVPQSEASCDPAAVTTWTDVYTTEYAWNPQTRAWELGEETGPVRSDESFTPYTSEEFRELCGPAQPPAETRTVPQSHASCAPAGVTTWTDVYTTEYVWSDAEQDWVAGQETGPVRTEESFVPYTDDELAEHCSEGKGDGGEDPNDDGQDPNDEGQSPNHGAQDDNPDSSDSGSDPGSDTGSTGPATAAAAAVPTVVNAGLGADVPPAPSPTPMWLLALGSGIGLMGATGLRRRATAHR